MIEKNGFTIAGFRPDFHFDIRADAGDIERGVAEIDFDRFTGDDDGFFLGRAEFDFAGLDEFAHFEVDFSAEDECVRVFGFLAEDLFDFL